MIAEEKVIEKIRKVLIADSTLNDYVTKRVHPQHISSISNPVLPAISLHLLPSDARFEAEDVVDMGIQIDAWLPVTDYTVKDVLACRARIRALLHRQDLTDTTIGVVVCQIFERGSGAIMYDEDLKSHHLPLRFEVTAI